MFAERVESYILKNRLILPGETVIVGFSGGPDSLSLAHLLWSLSRKHGWELILAHFDHQLRGAASREDAEFCKAWADAKGVPFFMMAMDIGQEARMHSESTELAARRCRYAFFRQVQLETGARRIALGHHRDDQAETVLMRLIRGTGTDGLAGMRPQREDGVIRPLLAESRQAILDYCASESLEARIDHTNFEEVYTRNGLRLEVLPLLAARYNPNIAEVLCRTAVLAGEDSDCLNGIAEKNLSEWGLWTGSTLQLPLCDLLTAPRAILKRLLRQSVRLIAGSVENLESGHLEQILRLLENSQTGKHIIFCGTRFAISYGNLVLSKEQAVILQEDAALPLEAGSVQAFGGRITLQPLSKEAWDARTDRGPHCIVVDREALCGPLRVRKRQNGDRMIPLGMETFKKLKDLMIDQKVPREVRDAVPIVCDDEKIVWAAGIRMDERVRVKDTSKILLEIRWEVCCSPE